MKERRVAKNYTFFKKLWRLRFTVNALKKIFIKRISGTITSDLLRDVAYHTILGNTQTKTEVLIFLDLHESASKILFS